MRLPFPSSLPALKNGLLYAVGVAAINAAGTGSDLFTVGMPCPAEETYKYKKEYPGCVPTDCPTGSKRADNGECLPVLCGHGEEYREGRGGCRPSNDFCESNPNLQIARGPSGYCTYAKERTPEGNDIDYDLVYCVHPSQFSAQANADTYINTDLDGKDLTTGKRPMCPPTGLFLALGERRRHHNPTDYYHPEWAIEDDLKKQHKKVIVRASGDCTVISDAVRLYNEAISLSKNIMKHVTEKLGELFPEGSRWRNLVDHIATVSVWMSDLGIGIFTPISALGEFLGWMAERKDGVFRLRSGMLAACQAHDYCYDLIRSGLHQTVQEGAGVGCDDVLRELWISYCHTLSWWPLLPVPYKWRCRLGVAEGLSLLVRAVTTPPEAGIVVLRNSKTGKCLTRKPESTKVVQERCRFNEQYKPNDEDQWFHILQAEPFSNAAAGPTKAGYFYVMPANVNSADQRSWKKSETEVAASRCLYVGSVSGSEVREGSCMVSGARSSSRVFRLVNTSVVDEYGIRSVWNGCWQPKVGEDDAETETAADGVAIISVANPLNCGAVLQRWRIEPVDPTTASR